jgi:plasmid stability protein
MASLTVRNLDNNLKSQLRLRAAQHGCSMEAEVRSILYQTLSQASSDINLADRIHQRFVALDADSLPIPPRQAIRTPPDFDETA